MKKKQITDDTPDLAGLTTRINAIGAGGKASHEIYELVEDWVRAMAKRYLKRYGVTGFRCTDVVNEAFLKAIERADHSEWKDSKHFLGWLCTTMRNMVIDECRRAAKANLDDPGTLGGLAESRELDPSIYVEMAEELEQLGTCLERLDVEARILVGLRHFLDYTLVDIGRLLDLGAEGVRHRLMRVTEGLRDCMADPELDIPLDD